jgi:hypothetical protein
MGYQIWLLTFKCLMMKNEVKIHEVSSATLKGRREFLKISGLVVATTGMIMMGSNDDDNPAADDKFRGIRNGKFDLGGNDLGVLSYPYALEQLEADFCTNVVNASNFTITFNASERQVLTDLYCHEVIHREFFKTALTGALPSLIVQLLPNLAFNYGGLISIAVMKF